ncbi:MAG: hypothetical protein JWN24_5032 [Phycisphaerales bacterium]|nr:hypothetical protein [Phycisphaerales bacterium]
MYLTKTQKELISRVTMAIVALALFITATVLLVEMLRVGMLDLGRLLIPVIVLLYVVALVFACFVFTPWDSRRANVGRAMAIGDKLSDGISTMFDWLWGRRWW